LRGSHHQRPTRGVKLARVTSHQTVAHSHREPPFAGATVADKGESFTFRYSSDVTNFGLAWLEILHPADAGGATLMSKGREIHCYDYVNHPYEQVRDALSRDAPAVFQSATKAAASRAQSIASELRIDIGGIGIETDIRVSVKKIEARPRAAMSRPATRLQLEWQAARTPRLFPLMKADLSIYSLTATELKHSWISKVSTNHRSACWEKP